MKLIALYLSAIVAANLIVTQFGPSASVLTAFLFIGLTITTRDRLHELWRGNLRRNMGALIATGSVLSWLLNADAGRIALASFVAFAISETADALVYQRMIRAGWFRKVNASNVVSASLDSVLFPTLAFGVFLPWVILGQFFAKVFGGAIWSWFLRPRVAAIAVLVLLSAVPAQAQIASVGIGGLTYEYGTDPVLEVYTATPEVLPRVRPYAITSFNLEADNAKPTIIGAVDFTLYRGAVLWNVGTGAIFQPFKDYSPEWLTSTTAVWKPFKPFGFVVIASIQPTVPDSWAIVWKFDYTLAFRS